MTKKELLANKAFRNFLKSKQHQVRIPRGKRFISIGSDHFVGIHFCSITSIEERECTFEFNCRGVYLSFWKQVECSHVSIM